ncbi:MAG: hypothetical protein C0425_06970 [Chlorobiaceae bacterium]|nr:hypothetical protein [Chlorobiaceae bacterium]MBA4310064.1 hypothetical protein [Chlorobiaceae bacterium]
MNRVELKIEGMNCNNCIKHLKEEFLNNENINVIDVQIGAATLEYDVSKISRDYLAEIIDEAGYKLVDLKIV